MVGDTFVAVNRRVEDEKRAKFCGTASIRVASLQYRDALNNGSKLERKNAESLKQIFRQERGYRREDQRHHAVAIISQAILHAALQASNLSIDNLAANVLPYPELEIPAGVKLECLQGSDRLAVANDLLPGGNKRWVVDLILDDLSDELKTMLAEDYDYGKSPHDGEFYRKIRGYQGIRGNEHPFFERLWLGRLATSKNKCNRFEQLTRNKKYLAAFDQPLDIPALLGGLRLSVVHNMLRLKCDQPNLAYLKGIHKWWAGICNNESIIMGQINSRDVEVLQGKAPGAFRHDYDELFTIFQGGQLFRNVQKEQRLQMWKCVCNSSQQVLIPSLYTFFEDQKFLVAIAESLRVIVDVGPRDSIPSRLEEMFTDIGQNEGSCIIQTSNTKFTTVSGDIGTRLHLGILQLWLAAIRMFEDLPTEPQKKNLLAKPRTKADKTAAYELAALAHRLGFESDKITKYLSSSADREIARRAFLDARKHNHFQYSNLEHGIQRIIEIFNSAIPIEPDIMEQDMQLQSPQRYGMPHKSDHERDKRQLFLPNMISSLSTGDETHMTSFFVRRSVFQAYFGDIPMLNINTFGEHQETDDAVMPDQDHVLPSRKGSWHLERSVIRRHLDSEPPSETGIPDESLNDYSSEIEVPNETLNDYSSEYLLFEQQDTQQEQMEETRLHKLQEESKLEQEKLEKIRADILQAEEVRRQNGQVEANARMLLPAQDDNTLTSPLKEVGTQLVVPDAANAPTGQRQPRPITHFAFGGLEKKVQREEEVIIKFIERKGGAEKILRVLVVDGTDSFGEVKRVAAKYLRKNYSLFDIEDQFLTSNTCFDHVTANGSYKIILKYLHIDKESKDERPAKKSRLQAVEEESTNV